MSNDHEGDLDLGRRRSVVNGLLAALQVLVVSISIFMSYRLVIRAAGADQFGLFSLMYAISTVVQIGALGAASGAARHVADLIGRGSASSVSKVAALSLATTTLGGVVVAGVLYPLIGLYADHLSSAAQTSLALELRPLVLLAALTVSFAATTQALVDGLHRAYLRAVIAMVGAVVYLGVVAITASDVGIKSLPIAVVAQQLLSATASLAVFFFYLKRANRAGHAGSPPKLLRAALGYNARLQFLTLPTLGIDPLVKIALERFAGLHFVALYEIANRLMQQSNAIVISAGQTLIPRFSHHAANGSLQMRDSFVHASRTIGGLSVLVFIGATTSLPLVGLLVVGDDPTQFIQLGLILAVGWLANCLSSPGYFLAISVGDFRANTRANYGMAIVLAPLCLAGGAATGGLGVGAGFTLALTLGGSYIFVLMARELGAHATDLIRPQERLGLMGVATVIVAIDLLAAQEVLGPVPATVVGAIAAAAILLGLLGPTIRASVRTRREQVP